jgi:REP element-mobilizing transposase RayT
LRELCEQFDIELVEGHAMPDHVHLCLSIPPKYSLVLFSGKCPKALRVALIVCTVGHSVFW